MYKQGSGFKARHTTLFSLTHPGILFFLLNPGKNSLFLNVPYITFKDKKKEAKSYW